MIGASLAAACGGGASGGVTTPVASTPVLTEVRILVPSDTLLVGQSATASVAGLDQNGGAIGIGAPTWSSSSPSVAVVSAGGVVTAVAPGKAILTATISGKQGQLSLIVVQSPVSRISITPGAARVALGGTVQLAATPLDFSGRVLPGRVVGWASSDSTKAIVTSAGVATALSPGIVSVSATSEGVSASAQLTVTSVPDSVATVTLTPGSGSLLVGGSLQLVATLRDEEGNALSGRSVTWTASAVTGGNVAAVSEAGLVSALAPGIVIVEAFCEGRYGAATVTVGDVVDTTIVVTFARPAVNELVGDTLLIYVGVKSKSPLASVVAAVGSLQTTLVFTQVGALGGSALWVGSIDMSAVASGSYQVVTIATDVLGSRGVGSMQFQRDTRVGKGGSGSPPKMK